MNGVTMMRTPPANIPVAGLPADIPEPRYVRLACPKCCSRDLELIECWQSTIVWTVTAGWMDKAAGAMEPGHPLRVEASCNSCGHGWRLRGAGNITDALEPA